MGVRIFWGLGCRTHREGHFSDSIEEHLQRCKEEEARIQMGVVNAIWSNVGPQKQGRTDDASERCLHISANCCTIKISNIFSNQEQHLIKNNQASITV